MHILNVENDCEQSTPNLFKASLEILGVYEQTFVWKCVSMCVYVCGHVDIYNNRCRRTIVSSVLTLHNPVNTVSQVHCAC